MFSQYVTCRQVTLARESNTVGEGAGKCWAFELLNGGLGRPPPSPARVTLERRWLWVEESDLL